MVVEEQPCLGDVVEFVVFRICLGEELKQRHVLFVVMPHGGRDENKRYVIKLDLPHPVLLLVLARIVLLQDCKEPRTIILCLGWLVTIIQMLK